MIGKTNGNLYAKEGGIEYEQLVNYIMIYDGSLGEASKNQHSEITGGWITNQGSNTWTKFSTITQNNDNMYAYRSDSWNGFVHFQAKNMIDYTGYKGVFAVVAGREFYKWRNFKSRS